MKSIKQVLRVYKTKGVKRAKKLRFSGVGRHDVYNITSPFKYKRNTYILGRVEPRDFEEEARVIFFKKKNEHWILDSSCPDFGLQDPFITKISGMYVLGGIEVQRRLGKEVLSYRTVFYRGSDIHSLRQFAHGPWGMKDIRLVELSNEKIGVFTRPQGKKGRRGKIGFVIIDSLQELTPRIISRAPIIDNLFSRGEWGGANEALILKNSKIGVLGHIARYSKDGRMRFYYPMTFCFDHITGKTSTFRMLVRRAELPEGEAKRPDVYNVVFPGGIVRLNGGIAKLFVGVGDAEAYELTIADPFLWYEENF